MFDIKALPNSIPVGRTGEQNYEALQFDVSPWIELYPDCKISLVWERPDGEVIKTISRISDGILSWTPSAYDLEVAGTGAMELVLESGSTIGKSASVAGVVRKSIGDSEPEPVPAPTEEKDINFWDWDGKLVACYDFSELPIANLPDAPDHSKDTVPMVFMGWTMTLDEVNAATEVLDVGACYDTADGNTYLHIAIDSKQRTSVPLYLMGSSSTGITIDWGDGSEPENTTEFTVRMSHRYPNTGEYYIKLSVGTNGFLNLGNNTDGVLGNGEDIANSGYTNMLREVWYGKAHSGTGSNTFAGYLMLSHVMLSSTITELGGACFRYTPSLSYITLPNAIRRIYDEAFVRSNLSFVSLPTSANSTGNAMFRESMLLKRVHIPNGYRFLNPITFATMAQLQKVVIPPSVESLGSQCFSDDASMVEYHFKPTVPPSLGSDMVFLGSAQEATFYVPKGCLQAYRSADVWSTLDLKMTEE